MSDTRLGLLVVDDDELIAASIRMALPPQWKMIHTSTPNHLPSGSFVGALVDMHLTGNTSRAEGVQVIEKLRAQDPHLEIVAISGNLDRQLMEACLKAGASRFLAKPLTPEELDLTLGKIEALHLLRNAATRGKSVPWVGSSEASKKVQREIASLKGEGGPILIEGESGTGKEVAAALIHSQEKNLAASRPFITVNLAAIPETVFESEFFGHVRGAFTGADQNKMGLAEAAHGGDLFLDEVEALPLTQQAKLLRFLESGEVRRVGGKDSIRVTTRVISATNRNLETLVSEGKFREDLLWRLNGRKLLLPPLRDRIEDVAELAEFFLNQERPRRNKTIDPDAIPILANHSWPGNVREFRRVIEQLALHAPLPMIRREDVQRALPSTVRTTSLQNVDLSVGLTKLLDSYEAQLIRMALEKKDDVDEAALLLGISRSSLYKKIKDHDIDKVAGDTGRSTT